MWTPQSLLKPGTRESRKKKDTHSNSSYLTTSCNFTTEKPFAKENEHWDETRYPIELFKTDNYRGADYLEGFTGPQVDASHGILWEPDSG